MLPKDDRDFVVGKSNTNEELLKMIKEKKTTMTGFKKYKISNTLGRISCCDGFCS